MRHASWPRAMSGIACETMRLGVADELQGRASTRNKERIFLGDGCMMTFQLGASSSGRKRPLSPTDVLLPTLGDITLPFVA
jgi:hypothetical protein